jgi:hypothetical protein
VNPASAGEPLSGASASPSPKRGGKEGEAAVLDISVNLFTLPLREGRALATGVGSTSDRTPVEGTPAVLDISVNLFTLPLREGRALATGVGSTSDGTPVEGTPPAR